MSAANPVSLTERLHSAINQPSLILRCQEISQLLHEVSSKDGSYVLRTVIESVFGAGEETATSFQQQQLFGGWGLRIITLSEHRLEFQTMRAFLSPNGPLLNLVYRLSHDPFQLLPFPIAWLPAKVRTEIQDGTAGPFYTSKIQNLGPGKSPINILFNAFEYYMFHFGYFLVGNGAQRWNLYWTSVRDSLYPTLLEDYLSSYLSCDATLPPGPSTGPVSPSGVLSPVSQRQNTGSHFAQSPQNLSLIMSPIAPPLRCYEYNPHLDGGGVTPHQTSSPLHPSVSSQNEVSTWTSQALIQVLMEIWINLCVPPPANASAHQPTSLQSMQLSMNVGHPALSDVFVPMGDHVRAVRMLVKHFHYFSNSLKPQQSSPLDPLRRNIWPMCRKSVFYFMKHLFIHWPLDSSFRLVLETWLSYIQPWRYVTYTSLERSPGQFTSDNDVHRSVDTKWKGYIAENLLFYSHLFGLFVRRVLRLDLASPKNANILFRVAKVFSQDNFMSMIQEVEDLLEANQLQKSFLGFVGGFSTPTPFTKDNGTGEHQPQVITQMVRSHILELEKPNYQYLPLFGESMLKDVYRLIRLTKKCHNALKAELAENPVTANVAPKEAGWWSSIYKALFETPQSREEENSLEEMNRCVSHLDASMNQFCIMFNMTIPETSSDRSHNQTFSESLLGTPEKCRIPEQTLTNSGPKLTDFGRYQLLNGLRRMDLKYEGDPDLQPICTFEVGFLVRFLYLLTRFINTKYEGEIIDLYYRRDFLGNISRVILSPPCTVYEYRRTLDADNPQTKVSKDLPPRIRFRVFAHKMTILSITIFYLLMWMLGMSFFKATLQLVFPFVFTYVLCKAALQRAPSPTLSIRNRHTAADVTRRLNLEMDRVAPTENRGF